MATTTNKTVIVSLYHDSQEISYEELTLSEAKERLATPMENRHRYAIPSWQFQNERGDASESDMQDAVNAAYKAVREA